MAIKLLVAKKGHATPGEPVVIGTTCLVGAYSRKLVTQAEVAMVKTTIPALAARTLARFFQGTGLTPKPSEVRALIAEIREFQATFTDLPLGTVINRNQSR